MSDKQKYIGGGIVIIVIAVVALLYSKHVYFRSPVIFLPDSQHFISTNKGQQVWGEGNDATFSNLKEVSGGSATDARSYEAAYRLYQGRMIQLDSNCQAMPLTLLIPPKSVIMIGNDSQWQRTVIVGPRTYNIAPYDYVLATFNTSGNFAITCDSIQSVAIISVQ